MLRRLLAGVVTLAGCKSHHDGAGKPAVVSAAKAPSHVWVSVGHLGAGVQVLLARPDGTAIAIGARDPKAPWKPRPDVSIFDPKTNGWSAGPPLSVARNDLSAVVLHDGAVLVFGGSSADDQDVGVAERLDPGATAWKQVAPMPEAGRYVAAVVLPSGMVFAASGRHGYRCTDAAMMYDPAADRWSSLAPMPQAHTGAIAVLDGKGQPVIIHGVCDDNGENRGKLFGPYRYDVGAATWTMGPPMAETFGATASLGDGRTLVVGGMDYEAMEPITTTRILDATDSSWQPAAPALTRRTHGTAIRVADGKVMVVGGAPVVDVYDPAKDGWTQSVAVPTATWDMPAVVLRDGRVLVTAGFDSKTEIFGDESWVY